MLPDAMFGRRQEATLCLKGGGSKMENGQTLKWLLSALKSSQKKNKKHFTIRACSRRQFITSNFSISEICFPHFFDEFLMSFAPDREENPKLLVIGRDTAMY